MSDANALRQRAKREEAWKRAEGVLDAAAEVGLTSVELTALLGLSSESSCTKRLRLMVAEGRVGRWPDPISRCGNRQRYWSMKFYPAKCPPPTGAVSAPLRNIAPARAPSVPLERRFTIDELPKGYASVVDSSQCRAWAVAAAQCIAGGA